MYTVLEAVIEKQSITAVALPCSAAVVGVVVSDGSLKIVAIVDLDEKQLTRHFLSMQSGDNLDFPEIDIAMSEYIGSCDISGVINHVFALKF